MRSHAQFVPWVSKKASIESGILMATLCSSDHAWSACGSDLAACSHREILFDGLLVLGTSAASVSCTHRSAAQPLVAGSCQQPQARSSQQEHAQLNWWFIWQRQESVLVYQLIAEELGAVKPY